MKSKSLLKQHDLRNTPSRIEVLDYFLEESKALSQGEIESSIQGNFDRVTIYRTLRTFLNKGILHKVLDDEGSPKYALCSASCIEKSHQHDHIHFKCSECGYTTCLDQVKLPNLQLPKAYHAIEINVLVQGICPNCQ